jgi:hypothetical protein
MVNVFRNERVNNDKKVLWAVVLFMGGMIAMPIYWYLYIWRDEKGPAIDSNAPKSLNNADETHLVNNMEPAGKNNEYVPPSQPPDWR